MKNETETVNTNETSFKAVDGSTVAFNLSQPPSVRVKAIVEVMYSKEHWKYPTDTFKTKDAAFALEVGAGLDWYLGGHEMTGPDAKGWFTLSSKGYFHYIGA